MTDVKGSLERKGNPIAPSPISRHSVVPLAREYLKSISLRGDLDLAEFAVERGVLRIVAQAVLMMQFVGDLVQRFLELVDPMDLQHPPARGFREFLQHVLAVVVSFIGVDDVAMVEAAAFPRRIV